MNEETLHINVDGVLREKLAKYYPFIPRALVRWIERTICQDELNELLDNNAGKKDADFADAVLHDLQVKTDIIGKENLPDKGTGRYIFASNHPLGGLDGIALLSLLCHAYDGTVKCVVNDMLMQVKPLSGLFLPANKHGRQSENAVKAINDAYASDNQMLHFPAGLCSRKLEGGIIADLDWKKSFITKSIEYHRDVIPVYFGGHNSNFFYNFAKLRKHLGIKLNIEMVYLPGEVFKSRGKTFSVVIGEPIPWTTFTDDSIRPAEHAARVRERVYQLKTRI